MVELYVLLSKVAEEAGEWIKKAVKFFVSLFINIILNAHTEFWSGTVQL